MQSKVQAIESRERATQSRSENVIQTLQREKKVMEDRLKDLVARVRRLEGDLSAEESQREQIRSVTVTIFVNRQSINLLMYLGQSFKI